MVGVGIQVEFPCHHLGRGGIAVGVAAVSGSQNVAFINNGASTPDQIRLPWDLVLLHLLAIDNPYIALHLGNPTFTCNFLASYIETVVFGNYITNIFCSKGMRRCRIKINSS